MNKILLNERLTKWLLLKRRHSVYYSLLKPNRISKNFRTKCGRDPPSRPSIRARNLWRRGQCSIKGGVDENIDLVRNRTEVY